ncbi:ribonuclease D [Halomonas salicampi]|uniref:Ribonuclease D n=1 Tax=Vreelandella salicampi TaxID=1449798 RepID=A0A7Z0LL32_9GAMM|nr:ribonuclease D [Halomonas salicampi]
MPVSTTTWNSLLSIASPSYHWIDTPQALDDACEKMTGASVIALDTEFFRENSFYPVPALIQFACDETAYLIDPLATDCTPAFKAMLENGPTKLLHASSEDLDVFQRWAGVLPTPLIDTQVAQGFLSENPGMGYQKLVEFWTGETLPKEETRSDWLERPLSEAQCCYAALDVIYLLEVWSQQADKLHTFGRLRWVEQECQAIVSQAQVDSADQWFTRQRQLWRLTPRQIEAYRQMTTWREGETRQRNLPRNWLVSDKVLFAIAEAMPKNRFELAKVEGVKPPLVKKEGDALLALVKQAHACPDDALPAAWPDPARPPFKPLFKALKKAITAQANELGVAPEMLMRRRDIEQLVMQSLAHEPLTLPVGWRGECLNPSLTHVLQEESK